MEILKKLFPQKKSERGASMLEYALLASLISVVVIVAVSAVGNQANATFKTVKEEMAAAGSVDPTAGSNSSNY